MPIFSRFGADFFTVYADFSRFVRDINGEKKTSRYRWAFSRLAFHGLDPWESMHKTLINTAFCVQLSQNEFPHAYFLLLHPASATKLTFPNGPTIKKIQSRSKFSISIEIFNLDRKFQSRHLDLPTKNRAAVGGSLENSILARNFQSRSRSRIFLIFGPSGFGATWKMSNFRISGFEKNCQPPQW